MPHVRHWPFLSAMAFLAAVALGLVAAHTQAIQPHDLALDRVLERDTRSGALTPTMMTISTLFSPVGGVAILALWTSYLLFVRAGRR